MTSTSSITDKGAKKDDDETCQDCQPLTATPRSEEKATKEDILDKSTFASPLVPAGQLPSPTLIIEFCHRCRFFPRASWIQTELWLTFPPQESRREEEGQKRKEGHINSIVLLPRTSQETGGRFRIWINVPLPGHTEGKVVEEKEDDKKWNLLWDRKTDGGFPELRKLKQLIRDRIAPGSGLGHSDKKVSSE